MFLVSFSFVFAQSIEARCYIDNEDAVGAVRAAPTTSELSTILLPTKMRLILVVLQYTFKIKARTPQSTMS